MSPRRALPVLLVLLIALVAGAALRPPSARAVTRDTLMKTSVLALQCAIEKHGSARMWVYPEPRIVSPAGGLASDFWPRDPWTGRRLTPGSSRGHYIYERAEDRRSYRLTGYLSGGRTFVVKGRMAHLSMLAYDHRGKEGLSLVFLWVKQWSRAHDGRLPAATEVSREGAVGRQRGDLIWPSNPWSHGVMKQGAARGNYAYERSADGKSFTLALHQSLKDDFVLRGTAAKSTAGDRP